MIKYHLKFSRFIYIVEATRFLKAEHYSTKNINNALYFFSYDGHLQWSHILASVNNTVMNLRVHACLWCAYFISRGNMLDHMALLFNWKIILKCGEMAQQLRSSSAPVEDWSMDDNSFVNCLEVQLTHPLLTSKGTCTPPFVYHPTHIHIIKNKILKQLNHLCMTPESYSNWHLHKLCAGGPFSTSLKPVLSVPQPPPDRVCQGLSFACLTMLNVRIHDGQLCAFLHFSPCNWVLGSLHVLDSSPYAWLLWSRHKPRHQHRRGNGDRETRLHKVSLQAVCGAFSGLRRDVRGPGQGPGGKRANQQAASLCGPALRSCLDFPQWWMRRGSASWNKPFPQWLWSSFTAALGTLTLISLSHTQIEDTFTIS